jgi:hypothetical protein
MRQKFWGDFEVSQVFGILDINEFCWWLGACYQAETPVLREETRRAFVAEGFTVRTVRSVDGHFAHYVVSPVIEAPYSYILQKRLQQSATTFAGYWRQGLDRAQSYR